MNTLAAIFAAAAAACALALFAASAVAGRRRARGTFGSGGRRREYVSRIVRILGEGPAAACIVADTPRRRMALAEAMHLVMRHTYGADAAALQDTVDRNALDRFLLRRIARSRGARRAHLLALISSVPSHGDLASALARYTVSRDRDVRIRALVAVLAANPAMAIRTLASYRYALTPFDVAQIVALLRRGLLPIAFEPLLANSNRNLRMLGMAIVRDFGIVTAGRPLYNIAVSDRDPLVVREALYTLASLGRPLDRVGIRERLAAMTAARRKELCRHLAAEGYSPQAVRALMSEHESRYAESLINSYKRDLVCR